MTLKTSTAHNWNKQQTVINTLCTLKTMFLPDLSLFGVSIFGWKLMASNATNVQDNNEISQIGKESHKFEYWYT